MALKKKTAKKPARETTTVAHPKTFVGVWTDYKRTFNGVDVGKGPKSTFHILPGNKVEYKGKVVICKVSKNTIRIPYGTDKASYWLGEMLPEEVLKISTNNGMMSYFCKHQKQPLTGKLK